MNLFGYENIDERLKAIFDEAGNTALKVTWLAAIAVIIIRTQVLGYQDFDFELIVVGMFIPGLIAHLIVTRKYGITQDSIVDEQYRNGYFANMLKNRFWRKTASRGLIVCAIAIAHTPYKEWRWYMFGVFAFALAVGIWLEYVTIKGRLAKENRAGAEKEEMV